MRDRFDAIVVGAGLAGCMAARTLAEKGFSTCLIEAKPAEKVGEKVCADAVGKHHFDRLGLAYPKGEELREEVKGIRIFSPSREISFFVPGDGFILNRKAFGQRLLKEALDAGAELLDETRALAPIVKDGFVVGVVAKDLREGRRMEFYGDVSVDASGFLAVLRRNMPAGSGLQAEVDGHDYCVGYREVREVREEPEPGVCRIYLSGTLAPGGYAWVFPAGEGKVNVGLGVQAVEGHPNPKSLLYGTFLKWPAFEGSRLIEAGGWFIPTRRPLENMVWNGLILAGDAACQANPLHGGGIGHALLGGSLAGEVASDALEEGDASLEALWPYNRRYMELVGARNAELDVFRCFLQNLDDDDIEFGMRKKLVSEEDLAAVSEGRSLEVGVREKLARALRGLTRPGFLKRLARTLDLMKAVRAHYGAYPSSPSGFGAWEKKAKKLFSEAREL